jgi:hypothetical protein
VFAALCLNLRSVRVNLKQFIFGLVLSIPISAIVYFTYFPPFAWAALIFGLPWNIPGISYAFWDLFQHGYDGPVDIHDYISGFLLFIGLHINCSFAIKYVFKKYKT